MCRSFSNFFGLTGSHLALQIKIDENPPQVKSARKVAVSQIETSNGSF